MKANSKGTVLTLNELQENSINNSEFEIIASGMTHTGHVRTRNEDSILLLDEESTWLVADGMGGHHAGDFASQTITRNMGLFRQQKTLEDSVLLIEENILSSNSIIREKSSKLGRDATIGSTVVCIYIWKNLLFTFWAGDSRLYRYRNNKLERITDDHSYVEELVRMGKIEAKDAELHPAANVVLKAVGIDDELCLDFDYVELQPDDIFVVCSDGLYKDLNEEKLATVVNHNQHDMALLSQSLMNDSLDSGGTDNTSIISLKVKQKISNV